MEVVATSALVLSLSSSSIGMIYKWNSYFYLDSESGGLTLDRPS